MSLTLIIIINVALDAALLGGLAWVLSRPARFTPHAHPRTVSRVGRAPRRAVAPTAHAAHAAADWSEQASRTAA